MNKDFDVRPPEQVLPPEELPPPGEEITPPPEEFPPPRAQEEEPQGKRRRRLLRALAAGALLLLLLGPRLKPALPAPEPVPSPAPSALPAPTPEPAPSPEPSPVPSPEPTPESTELRCELVFFSFSALHQGSVRLVNAGSVVSATAEIWEKNLDTLEWSGELTAEDIAAGSWELPAFDDSDTYFRHMDTYQAGNGMPELELRVTLTLEGEQGPETLLFTAEPSYEQGWGVRYWPEDYAPFWDGEEYYPGCFALMSYEAEGAPPEIRMGSEEDARESGAICVSLALDGKPVSDRDCRVLTREEPVYRYDEKGELVPSGRVYYYTTLVIPRPADAPASGRAVFTVWQRLHGYDLVWRSTRELDY